MSRRETRGENRQKLGRVGGESFWRERGRILRKGRGRVREARLGRKRSLGR